jgi:hypothetical protein
MDMKSEIVSKFIRISFSYNVGSFKYKIVSLYSVSVVTNSLVLEPKGPTSLMPKVELLPAVAARVRSHIRSYEICSEQSGIGVGFLRVLWFPLLILTTSTTPHS